jgi:uncharacterized cupredoxin-like copper-binding protein
MYKTISTLVLATLPVFAMAGGAHSGGHTMESMGNKMAGMQQDSGTVPAVGKAGEASKVTRTVEVAMDDNMRFTPSQISVNPGETVRFFIKNGGKVPHEMVLGSMDDLKAHAAMMQKMPGMKHAESNMITLQPGQRGGLVWQFADAGTVDFACTIPGHLEAGMAGKVVVQ